MESSLLKTIILVWTNKLSCGIGDLIRGSIGAIQYCEKRGYRCIIDITHHTISGLLKTVPHEYSDLVQENKNNIKFIPATSIYEYLDNTLKNEQVLLFFSNFGIDLFNEKPSIHTISSIKTLLTPNDMFSKYIDTKINELKISNFNILHFRLGDDEIIHQKASDYTKHINRLNDYKDSNSILISDSLHFKNYVKQHSPIFTFNDHIVHTGVNKDINKIKYTLFEFLLLTKASIIKSYSVYNWTSGFVMIANYIYEIPLVSINLLEIKDSGHNFDQKCMNKSCSFLRNRYIHNNIITHCCGQCKLNNVHGPDCEKILMDYNFNKKCTNPLCKFRLHSNINNNGGTHCCFACKDKNVHGPLCEKILIV